MGNKQLNNGNYNTLWSLQKKCHCDQQLKSTMILDFFIKCFIMCYDNYYKSLWTFMSAYNVNYIVL